MTIYLAICDNNIADRKQLERLLEREKDKRLAESGDVMYIDSFGSEESLMSTPVKYDIFFIDMTECGSDEMATAKKLRLRGINAPIVLCSSTINYKSYGNAPADITYIDKPINKGQVSHLVDVALEWSRRKTPLIEVRCQSTTRFIKYDELIYAVPVDKFLTRLFLTGGEVIDMTDSIESLARQCRSYGCFIRCRKDIVNICHIIRSTDNGFVLSNDDTVYYRRSQKNNVISAMAENMRHLKIH